MKKKKVGHYKCSFPQNALIPEHEERRITSFGSAGVPKIKFIASGVDHGSIKLDFGHDVTVLLDRNAVKRLAHRLLIATVALEIEDKMDNLSPDVCKYSSACELASYALEGDFFDEY